MSEPDFGDHPVMVYRQRAFCSLKYIKVYTFDFYLSRNLHQYRDARDNLSEIWPCTTVVSTPSSRSGNFATPRPSLWSKVYK